MQVTVKLYATLRTGRFSEKTIDIPSGTTIQDLITSPSLPKNEVTLSFVNGRHVK